MFEEVKEPMKGVLKCQYCRATITKDKEILKDETTLEYFIEVKLHMLQCKVLNRVKR